MNKPPLVPRPERESYVKHRRDMTRQIILPVILATLVGLGLGGLAIYGATASSANVGLWADISLIWLIIPMMVMALVILALLVALVYGLAKLLGVAPHYTGIAQEYVLWFNAQVSIWSDRIIQPIIKIKSWLELFVRSEE